MMSEVDRIYQKYMSIFYEVDGGGTWIDLSAVRYALRAALRELAVPPNPDPNHDRQGGAQGGAQEGSFTQHQYAQMAKQIKRLNHWLDDHAPDLAYVNGDLMPNKPTDTADAMIAAADRLRGTVERLRIELAAAIDERNVADAACAEAEKAIAQFRDEADQANEDMNAEMREKTELRQQLTTEIAALRSQLAQMDADNAKLAQELAILRSWSVAPHGNGAITDDFGTVITNPPPTLTPMATANGVTLSWPGDLADWVEGLEKGRHDWRKLAKSVRWQLIANVVNQVKDSVQFDAQRPPWMSTSRAAALTFGDGRWDKVVERAHRGEVVA